MKAVCLANTEEVALVDEADFDLVSKYRWKLLRAPGGLKYAFSSKNLPLHRLLIQDAPHHIDHINGNGLDNRRENLRLATARENAANSRMYRTNTSGYRGVHWNKERRKWVASIRDHQKKIHIGAFEHKYQAALAWNIRAKEVFGEFARLNNIMAMQL